MMATEEKKNDYSVDVDSVKANGDSNNEESVSPKEEDVGTEPVGGGAVEHGEDIAMRYANMSKDLVLTDEASKRIRRRVDMFVFPFMAFSYAIQFIDRATVSYAAIMGIREATNMTGDMYSWTATSFYLGYLFWSFPGSFSLQKLPLATGVCGYIFLWGLVLTLHAAVFNYAGVIVCRIFLGFFEAPLLPGLGMLTNNFYEKKEMYSRTAGFFAATGIGNILGAVIAYGVQKNRDSYVIEPWRFLFLILGIVTMVFSVMMKLVIPDTPPQAWWLKGDDKLLTVERIRGNEQGFGSKEFKWKQVKEAFLEPRAYIYMGLAMAVEIPNSGITAYASILLHEDFGYSTTKALLMKAPMGVVQLCGLGMLALVNKYNLVKHPLMITVFGLCVALTGGTMLGYAPTKYSRLAGFYLIGFSPVSLITAILGLSSNTAGRTKKVICNAMYLVGFCAGCCIGPQTFLPSEAPDYHTAKNCLIGFYSAGIALTVLLATYNWNSNRLRDKRRDDLGDKYVKEENSAFRDLTDRENLDFRYVW